MYAFCVSTRSIMCFQLIFDVGVRLYNEMLRSCAECRFKYIYIYITYVVDRCLDSCYVHIVFYINQCAATTLRASEHCATRGRRRHINVIIDDVVVGVARVAAAGRQR